MHRTSATRLTILGLITTESEHIMRGALGAVPQDRRNAAARIAIVSRIRAEFMEMPCLRLTRAQAQRLFGLREDICERVLAGLVAEGVLARGGDGRFGLPHDLSWRLSVHLTQVV